MASLVPLRNLTTSPPPPLLHFLPATPLFPSFQPIMGSFSSSSTSSSSSSSTPQQNNLHEHEHNLKLSDVLKYHNQTKHGFTHYARGPHGLDWSNQPNPFRRYLSSPLLPLLQNPTIPQTQTPLYHSLFHSLPSPQPISKSTISDFLFHSLSLSAWKSTGFSTWSLRVNPSSGNLHPTEAYVVAPPIPDISDSPFVAHYAPKEHSLELRAQIPSGFYHNFFPPNSFLLALSSVFWREAWKYGERAFRYNYIKPPIFHFFILRN